MYSRNLKEFPRYSLTKRNGFAYRKAFEDYRSMLKPVFNISPDYNTFKASCIKTYDETGKRKYIVPGYMSYSGNDEIVRF